MVLYIMKFYEVFSNFLSLYIRYTYLKTKKLSYATFFCYIISFFGTLLGTITARFNPI